MYREQNTTGCSFPEETRTSRAEYVQNLAIWDRLLKKRNMAPGMVRLILHPLDDHDKLCEYWTATSHDTTFDTNLTNTYRTRTIGAVNHDLCLWRLLTVPSASAPFWT